MCVLHINEYQIAMETKIHVHIDLNIIIEIYVSKSSKDTP